jgi:hypothetical protein
MGDNPTPNGSRDSWKTDSTEPSPISALDFEWVDSLAEESDRGSILVVQAVLENALKNLIESRVLRNKTSAKAFMAKLRNERSNPLGCYAACVDHSQKHKLLDTWLIAALRKLNVLRIEFAHEPRRSVNISDEEADGIFSLLSDDARGLAKQILDYVLSEGLYDQKRSNARRRFDSAALAMLIEIETTIRNQSLRATPESS